MKPFWAFCVLAILGSTAYVIFDTSLGMWSRPDWLWYSLWPAFALLYLNAWASPRSIFSPVPLCLTFLVGGVLADAASEAVPSWWPAWLLLGISIPMLGNWLIRALGQALRDEVIQPHAPAPWSASVRRPG